MRITLAVLMLTAVMASRAAAMDWFAVEGTAEAATVIPAPFVIPMEPDESLIIACDYNQQFGGATTVLSFEYSVLQRAGPADPHPEKIVFQQLLPVGLQSPLIIAPVGYCSTTSTTGCAVDADCPVSETCTSRHGNHYQVHVLSTMTNGQKPSCNYLIDVEKVVQR